MLTCDKVVERIEKADAQKAAHVAAKSSKSKKQGQSAAETTQEQDTDVPCKELAQGYIDNQADVWKVCDSCKMWWHYWCAGLPAVLTEEGKWLCCCLAH